MTKAPRSHNAPLDVIAPHVSDTSITVQVTILSERIANLTEHLKGHEKDRDSRRGLLKLVDQRKVLLNYLKVRAPNRYKQLAKELGLKSRKAKSKAISPRIQRFKITKYGVREITDTPDGVSVSAQRVDDRQVSEADVVDWIASDLLPDVHTSAD